VKVKALSLTYASVRRLAFCWKLLQVRKVANTEKFNEAETVIQRPLYTDEETKHKL
jgi:hypothetical protein